MIYNNSSKIELSKKAIKNNVEFLKSLIGNSVELSAVVKANAYGHGIIQMVPELEKNGVRYFSVFSSFEAREVRQATTVGSNIMIMGDIAVEDLEWVVENDIECVVYNFNILDALINEAKKQCKKVCIHLELETGMNRHGFRCIQWSAVEKELKKSAEHIVLRGISTHFAGAESSANYKRIQDQQSVFMDGLRFFRERDCIPDKVHTSCSAATLAYPEFNHDMVRVGIMLYGLWPSTESKLTYQLKNNIEASPLNTVLSWKSHVIDVSYVPSGQFVGYGNSYLTETDMKIASVPVGYGYGFNRSLSNSGRVLVNGKRLSVIGIVNMNMFLIDATNIDLEIGTEVTIIGKNGDQRIDVTHFGNLSEQMNYELLTRLDRHIPRILV
jgi:alanine racemase